MDTGKFKYVVGDASANKPAVMRFYGAVCEDSARDFVSEFLWLQDYVKPSKISVCINSEGGSAIHGMAVYSVIRNSPVETETIIDGIAASMGSIIWAAGTTSYMRDYSILMIHNPFIQKGRECRDEEDTPDNRQMIDAFRKQVETIYIKRFGLTKEKVKAIMDGAEGCDGTFFDAKQAVEAGIIPKENVLKTSKQIRERVKGSINDMEGAAEIYGAMASLRGEIDSTQPFVPEDTIHNKRQIQNTKTTMEKEQEFAFSSVCAQLGLDKASDISAVITRITALTAAEKAAKEARASLDALKIQKEGVDAQLANVSDELKAVKSELQTYKDAEAAQHAAEVAKVVDEAVSDGRIKAEAREKWVKMAEADFETVKATLDSIAKPDKISEAIAADPANVAKTQSGLTEAEIRMKAAVEEVVGKNFEFHKLD